MSMAFVKAVALAVLCGACVVVALSATVIDLGVPAGLEESRAYGHAGDYVSGTAFISSAPHTEIAWVYHLPTSRMTGLPPLPAPDNTRHTLAGFGNSINNNGLICGQSAQPDVHGNTHLPRSVTSDVNGSPQLTVHAPPKPTAPRAFVWSLAAARYDDFGKTYGWQASVAHALNNNGVVVGAYLRPDNTSSAYAYNSVTRTLQDLGARCRAAGIGKESEARAINDKGEVVGWALGLGAIYWTPTGDCIVIPHSEVAESINTQGLIAGLAMSQQFRSVPTVWERTNDTFTPRGLSCHYRQRDCMPTALSNKRNTTGDVDVVGVVRGRPEPWFFDSASSTSIGLSNLATEAWPFNYLISAYALDDTLHIVGDGVTHKREVHAYYLTLTL